MWCLEVKAVKKSYGNLLALDGIDFSVKQGEMFALLGPNGSGKTTLISVISSLLEPDAGEVKVCGQVVAADNAEAKAQLGLVPQEIINHGFFTVEEILQFTSGFYGLYRNASRCDYLMERLGLTEHRKKLVRQLSGGMKRRLLIAKALVHSPRLLLLDEPTAGVDIELRNSMWEFIRELNRDENMSILLTTHYLEEAETLCPSLAVISKGRLLECGPTKDLIAKRSKRQVVFRVNRPVTIRSPYLDSQTEEELVFSLPTAMNLGQLLAGIEMDQSAIDDILIREGSLEEAFLQVVKAEQGG